MTDQQIMAYHVLVRRKFNLLTQVLDISKEMGLAMDRNEDANVRKLLLDRSEPIQKLEELDGEMRSTRESMDEKARIKLKAVVAGVSYDSPKEVALYKEVSNMTALLQEVIALDARMNRRVSGNKSVYNNQTQG